MNEKVIKKQCLCPKLKAQRFLSITWKIHAMAQCEIERGERGDWWEKIKNGPRNTSIHFIEKFSIELKWQLCRPELHKENAFPVSFIPFGSKRIDFKESIIMVRIVTTLRFATIQRKHRIEVNSFNFQTLNFPFLSKQRKKNQTMAKHSIKAKSQDPIDLTRMEN